MKHNNSKAKASKINRNNTEKTRLPTPMCQEVKCLMYLISPPERCGNMGKYVPLSGAPCAVQMKFSDAKVCVFMCILIVKFV